jgi:hypothetical protein
MTDAAVPCRTEWSPWRGYWADAEYPMGVFPRLTADYPLNALVTRKYRPPFRRFKLSMSTSRHSRERTYRTPLQEKLRGLG